jgi:hypothetical protein
MVVNFTTHEISQGVCKLARTPTLIKKKSIVMQLFSSVDDHVISFVTFFSLLTI